MTTPSPVGRQEFFALEAGEYLERLTLLVAGPAAPENESLVRYARALRGSALMAGPPGYAIAAAAIENLAKALRDGSLRWSPALAERLSSAVEVGKSLLRRLREWSEEDIARCERTASELNSQIGESARRPPVEPQAAPTQSAAVRAYIARETAALAATLDQAAAAVERLPPNGLAAVLERLQPLRGLGALPGLSPLPELLEVLDLLLVHGAASGAWPPRAGRAFRATSAALARMARDIAALGLPQPDAPELVESAELLRDAFADEHDVVPIVSLCLTDAEGPIRRRGEPPVAPAATLDPAVELVGLADRLRHAGAQLKSGPPGPARALQLYALVFGLRGLKLSPAVNGTAGNLLCRLDRETMTGRAVPAAGRFAGLLERAAKSLADAAQSGGLASLSAVLAPLCEELDRSLPQAVIVPIESLAPDAPSDIVPIESLGYDLAPAYTSFEQTFTTYFKLRQAAPASTAHLSPLTSHPSPVSEVVPIQSLVYRGRRALERANRVRQELNAALRQQKQLAEVQTLLGELLDLVPLALDDSA